MAWNVDKKTTPSPTPVSQTAEPQPEPEVTMTGVVFSDDYIKSMLFPEKTKHTPRFCMMFYGVDGTGKTGLLQSYPLKKGEKHVILDLDGGNEPILDSYNQDRIGQIIINNPLETMITPDGRKTIDFKKTMDKIKWIVDYVRRNYEKDNIKAVSIDGLSKLLKYAEYQMRLDKHLTAEGGVDYRYWKVRNEMFMEIIEMMKSLPIDKFFVAHDDFIQLENDEKTSSVKRETNRVMYQKIRCVRRDMADRVEYSAIIDKSKYNVKAEGETFTFLTIKKDTHEVKWEGEKLYNLLIVDKK